LALTLSLLLGCNTDEPARDLGAKDRLAKPEAARPDRASCPLASCTVTSGRACCNTTCCSSWSNIELPACNVATGSCLTFCSDCLADGYRGCLTAGLSDGGAALSALCSKDASPGQ